MKTHFFRAMQTKTIHRNVSKPTEGKINLMVQLAILMRTHKESKYLCSATSIGYRVAGLCELAIHGNIEMSQNAVIVVKNHNNPILNDFTIKIAQSKLPPLELIKSLNGEKKKINSVKHLKSRLYKEITGLNYVNREKGMLNNKISIKNNEVWKKLFDKIVSECVRKKATLETRILLLCLEYINNMQDILTHCSGDTINSVIETMIETRTKLLNNTFSPEEALCYNFMKFLCKQRMLLT
ncbi:hypothetical protein NUSPORA_01448 [Nucleospora cyclopteri]